MVPHSLNLRVSSEFLFYTHHIDVTDVDIMEESVSDSTNFSWQAQQNFRTTQTCSENSAVH